MFGGHFPRMLIGLKRDEAWIKGLSKVFSDERIGIYPELKLVDVHLVVVTHQEIDLLKKLLSKLYVLLLPSHLLKKTIASITFVFI